MPSNVIQCRPKMPSNAIQCRPMLSNAIQCRPMLSNAIQVRPMTSNSVCFHPDSIEFRRIFQSRPIPSNSVHFLLFTNWSVLNFPIRLDAFCHVLSLLIVLLLFCAILNFLTWLQYIFVLLSYSCNDSADSCSRSEKCKSTFIIVYCRWLQSFH